MFLIKDVNSSYELQEMQQAFLSIGIQLSEEDFSQLLQYQYAICQKLDWVETSHDQLTKIIFPFLHSGWIYNENDMTILKQIVDDYHMIRSQFDYHTCDDMICQSLYQEFIKYPNMNFNTLKERTIKIILKEGGQYRVKQCIPIYR